MPRLSSGLALALLLTAMPAAAQVYTYQSTLGVAGKPGTDSSHFNAPAAITVDTVNSHVLIVDVGNNRVQVLDSGSLAVIGTIGVTSVAGTDNAHLNSPLGVGFDPATDKIYVADAGNDRIQIFDGKSLAYVATLGGTGLPSAANGFFDQPSSVHVNPVAHQLYIADTVNDRVQVYNSTTLAFIGTIGVSGVAGNDSAHLYEPNDAEYNPATNQIIVADTSNNRLQIFDATSYAYVGTVTGTDLDPDGKTSNVLPFTVMVDPATNLLVVPDIGANDRVQVFDATTYRYVATLGTTGSVGTGNNQFHGPFGAAADPAHGRLFISDFGNDRIQVFANTGVALAASVLPGSRSVELGNPATIFATMINAGSATLPNCRVALPASAPSGLNFSYQTTDPATNTPTGAPNTPVAIAGGDGVQSFILSFQGTAAFSAAAMPLDFACDGTAPAAIVSGVDTVDLTMSSSPVADVIALAATASGNGIAELPQGGAGAFAVATSNLGASADLTVSVDTGSATLPLTLGICQTDPSSGQCISTLGTSVTLDIASNAAPTFSVFLDSSGAIPLAPASSRIFVRFKDASGNLHGSTSVAVETE